MKESRDRRMDQLIYIYRIIIVITQCFRSTPSINTNIAVTPQVQETSGCDAARDVVAIDKPSPVDLEDRCGGFRS